ncbi:MAG: hypothetical protein A2103_00020 [Gammaproteobacteria bacterium GWF2_41_13]|nr:MAG: hypothetical protein A2103_00020 [Gammaproteobacteria bacterium GWF2_41_13]
MQSSIILPDDNSRTLKEEFIRLRLLLVDSFTKSFEQARQRSGQMGLQGEALAAQQKVVESQRIDSYCPPAVSIFGSAETVAEGWQLRLASFFISGQVPQEMRGVYHKFFERAFGSVACRLLRLYKPHYPRSSLLFVFDQFSLNKILFLQEQQIRLSPNAAIGDIDFEVVAWHYNSGRLQALEGSFGCPKPFCDFLNHLKKSGVILTREIYGRIAFEVHTRNLDRLNAFFRGVTPPLSSEMMRRVVENYCGYSDIRLLDLIGMRQKGMDPSASVIPLYRTRRASLPKISFETAINRPHLLLLLGQFGDFSQEQLQRISEFSDSKLKNIYIVLCAIERIFNAELVRYQDHYSTVIDLDERRISIVADILSAFPRMRVVDIKSMIDTTDIYALLTSESMKDYCPQLQAIFIQLQTKGLRLTNHESLFDNVLHLNSQQLVILFDIIGFFANPMDLQTLIKNHCDPERNSRDPDHLNKLKKYLMLPWVLEKAHFIAVPRLFDVFTELETFGLLTQPVADLCDRRPELITVFKVLRDLDALREADVVICGFSSDVIILGELENVAKNEPDTLPGIVERCKAAGWQELYRKLLAKIPPEAQAEFTTRVVRFSTVQQLQSLDAIIDILRRDNHAALIPALIQNHCGFDDDCLERLQRLLIAPLSEGLHWLERELFVLNHDLLKALKGMQVSELHGLATLIQESRPNDAESSKKFTGILQGVINRRVFPQGVVSEAELQYAKTCFEEISHNAKEKNNPDFLQLNLKQEDLQQIGRYYKQASNFGNIASEVFQKTGIVQEDQQAYLLAMLFEYLSGFFSTPVKGDVNQARKTAALFLKSPQGKAFKSFIRLDRLWAAYEKRLSKDELKENGADAQSKERKEEIVKKRRAAQKILGTLRASGSFNERVAHFTAKLEEYKRNRTFDQQRDGVAKRVLTRTAYVLASIFTLSAFHWICLAAGKAPTFWTTRGKELLGRSLTESEKVIVHPLRLTMSPAVRV